MDLVPLFVDGGRSSDERGDLVKGLLDCFVGHGDGIKIAGCKSN